jgi:hypothetical protein
LQFSESFGHRFRQPGSDLARFERDVEHLLARRRATDQDDVARGEGERPGQKLYDGSIRGALRRRRRYPEPDNVTIDPLDSIPRRAWGDVNMEPCHEPRLPEPIIAQDHLFY